MGQNENTKSGPEQAQDCPGPQASASQAVEPGNIKAESPRKCKICGSPNHHGCGCEAKRQARAMVEMENSYKKVEQPESETPGESEADDILEAAFSPEAIIKSDEVNKRMAKDIKTMADGFEGLCVCFYDTNQFLQIIAGDLITIRKFLTKEDEVKNAGADKDKN